MTIHPLTSSAAPLHLDYDADESPSGAPANSSLGTVVFSGASAGGGVGTEITVPTAAPSAVSSRAGTLDSRRRIECVEDEDAAADVMAAAAAAAVEAAARIGGAGAAAAAGVGNNLEAMLMSFSQNASPLHPLTGSAEGNASDEDAASSSNGGGGGGGGERLGPGGFPPLQHPPMLSVRWSSTLERPPIHEERMTMDAGLFTTPDRAVYSSTLERGMVGLGGGGGGGAGVGGGGCYTTLERRRFTVESERGEEIRRNGINRNASYDMTLNIPGEESTI